MANLIGYLKSEGGRIVSRLATSEIEADLRTWTGGVRVVLRADGRFTVFSKLSDGREIIAFEGEMSTKERVRE